MGVAKEGGMKGRGGWRVHREGRRKWGKEGGGGERGGERERGGGGGGAIHLCTLPPPLSSSASRVHTSFGREGRRGVAPEQAWFSGGPV